MTLRKIHYMLNGTMNSLAHVGFMGLKMWVKEGYCMQVALLPSILLVIFGR